MLYHRSTKACNLPVGVNMTFCNSVIYQLLMAKFFFNQGADDFCEVCLWPVSLTCLPNNVVFIFPANIKIDFFSPYYKIKYLLAVIIYPLHIQKFFGLANGANTACWRTLLNNFFILIFIYFKSLCLPCSVLATLLVKRRRMSFRLLPHKSCYSSYRNINQNHWCQNKLTSWVSHIIKIPLPASLNALLPTNLAQEGICLISQIIINCRLSELKANHWMYQLNLTFITLTNYAPYSKGF